MQINKLSKFALGGIGTLILSVPAHAMCPICTIAIGAGLGLSRWLGISDTVSGIWIGSLLFSASMWTINWLRSKKKTFKGMAPIVFIAYYALTIIPLYLTGIMGHPYNKFLGADRLLFGMIVGSFAFVSAVWVYELIKKKNGGKSWFPFQKVVMPVGFTIIASLIMYFIDK